LLLLFYSNSKFHVLGAAIRMYNNWTVYSTSLGWNATKSAWHLTITVNEANVLCYGLIHITFFRKSASFCEFGKNTVKMGFVCLVHSSIQRESNSLLMNTSVSTVKLSLGHNFVSMRNSMSWRSLTFCLQFFQNFVSRKANVHFVLMYVHRFLSSVTSIESIVPSNLRFNKACQNALCHLRPITM